MCYIHTIKKRRELERRRASMYSDIIMFVIVILSASYTIIIQQTGKRSTISKSNKFYVVCKYDFLLFILFIYVVYTINDIIIANDLHLNVKKPATYHKLWASSAVNSKECTQQHKHIHAKSQILNKQKWWRWFKFIVTAFLLWFYVCASRYVHLKIRGYY